MVFVLRIAARQSAITTIIQPNLLMEPFLNFFIIGPDRLSSLLNRRSVHRGETVWKAAIGLASYMTTQ